jgi:hypothetical protein
VCLEPHDLVISKLAAHREQDFAFASALLDAGLVDTDVLLERGRLLPSEHSITRSAVTRWIESARRKHTRPDG